jgi:tetratricopeptide (TPR) repeat protein
MLNNQSQGLPVNSTKLSAICDKVLEACWLLAVIVTPLFFNTASDNVFERDKWTTLRTIVLVMAAVWVVRLVEEKLSGRQGVQITWRTPLMLPILFTVLSYLISTAFSLTPYISIFGGYQRMRGILSTLSCVVICVIILDRMRSRSQVDRFISVVILNSLPIALYGFIQHSKLDPLPWGGDVTQRIASTMGNPIFVAAYMIMAALPTLARIVDAFRSILTDEETGAADVLRAAAYIFMFLVQVISVWYSGSRGPLMGLVVGLGLWMFLGLLALQRAAQREKPFQPRELPKDLGVGLAFGVGSLAAAGGVGAGLYFASRAILAPGSGTPQWVAAGGAVLALFVAWMVFIINRRGWRWLWGSALTIGLLFATAFFLVNLVFHQWSEQQPWLGRLDDVLQSESGTGMVRNLIWQGSLEMILPHDPVENPPTMNDPTEWRPDAFNFLRPLVGYGPESMYVAYNRFYPPLLGHYESRTATPDRAHNATIDRFVITGLIGVSAYLWVFGGIFYYGLRWLGALPDGWRRTLFLILIATGAAAATVAVALIPSLGLQFFGLAIPAGMVAGMFIYLVVYGFSLYWELEPVSTPHPRAILLTGILAAVVAHLIEVNFGIAIASTLTTFWAYAGILVVVGSALVGEREEELQSKKAGSNKAARKRRKQRRAASRSLPAWLGPTVALAIVGGFILGTLFFDFMTQPDPNDPYFVAIHQRLLAKFGDSDAAKIRFFEELGNPLTVIRRALTALANRSQETCTAAWNPMRSECRSYGMLMVFAFTWVMSTVVFIAQMAKRGVFRERPRDWMQAAGMYLMISLALGLGFALVLASHYGSRWSPSFGLTEENLAPRLASYAIAPMGYYYVFIVLSALAGGVTFLLGAARQPRQTSHTWGTVTLLVLAILVSYTSVRVNLSRIQADTIYKLAKSLESSQDQFDNAIRLYDMAIAMTPREDFFYFEKGRVFLTKSITQEEGYKEERVLAALQAFSDAHEIAPLNTDHVKGLAKTYQVWAQPPFASDDETRRQRQQLAEYYYDMATTLSPRNAFLWNEWAGFYLSTDNFEGAQRVVSQSLAVDDAYDKTWELQAAIYDSQNLFAEAAMAYGRLVEIDPGYANGWLGLGNADNEQHLFAEAADAYNQAVNLNPGLVAGWLGLAEAYQGVNNLPEAANAYQRTLELQPSNVDALYALGNTVYPQLGRLDEAVVVLQRGLESAPMDRGWASRVWEIHYSLAVVYDQLNQTEQAISHAQTALELAPADRKAEVETLLKDLQSAMKGG